MDFDKKTGKVALSIVIPAWNEGKHLPKLLHSIKRQSYKDYEMIVADANSTDNTVKVAKKAGCRVVKGGMPGVGRNAGAKAAKGELLLFLDADSTIDKDFLEKSIKDIKRRNLDIAASKLVPTGKHPLDRIYFKIYRIWLFGSQFIAPDAIGTGIFCKKKLHDKVGGFDESIKLGEDGDYTRRCSKHGKFGILKTICYFSTRRLEHTGRLKYGIKMALFALYRPLFGTVKKDVFKYDLKYRKK